MHPPELRAFLRCWVPIALHAEPPARPAPPIVADTAFRDSTLIYLHEMAGTVVDSLEALGVKSPSGLVAVSVGVGGADARMSIIGGNVPDSLRRNVGRIVGTYVNRRGTGDVAHVHDPPGERGARRRHAHPGRRREAPAAAQRGPGAGIHGGASSPRTRPCGTAIARRRSTCT
jgi:hypothetical protein